MVSLLSPSPSDATVVDCHSTTNSMVNESKNFSFSVQDTVTAVEFAPFDWCGSLLAVGTQSGMVIVDCYFQEEESVLTSVTNEVIRNFHHEGSIKEIRWGPQTSLAQLPKELVLLTVSNDTSLRIFKSDFKDDKVLFIEGHTDFINDAAFEPQLGEDVASVSDDHTCQIFSINGTRKCLFYLSWPGMSVSYHSSEPGKLMVAQRNGVIRFYNVMNQQALMSIDGGCSPLLCAQWNFCNSSIIGAVAGSEWLLWNKNKSSLPEVRRDNEGVAVSLHFSRCNEDVFAVCEAFGKQIKVIDCQVVQPLFTTEVAIGRGISWHCKLKLLAIGEDASVHFYKIE